MTTTAATAPSSAPNPRRALSWLFREIVLPLLLGLGIGAGALAPCGKGECSDAPKIVSHP